MDKINYFTVINRFFDEAPYLDGYKTDHPALFFAIIDSINRNRWHDTEIEYDRIINKVKLGKANYLKARDWLSVNRFIRFVPGKGDYQKAKFGLGSAVLGKTADSTPQDTAYQTDAVPPKTATDTAGSTAPHTAGSGSAVLGKTAGDTTPDTAADTHLIGIHITSNSIPTNQQQHQQGDSPDGNSHGGVDDWQIDESFSQKKEQGAGENPTPFPLPKKEPVTASQFRETTSKNGKAYRYAVEQLKLATDQAGFVKLIDVFLSQQDFQSDSDEELTFPSADDAKRHFMNWLGKRETLTTTSPNNANGNQRSNARGKGNLRPTSLGQSEYRGTGSTCDVEV